MMSEAARDQAGASWWRLPTPQTILPSLGALTSIKKCARTDLGGLMPVMMARPQ